jgi:CheY-like chemotaxis protein
MAALARARSRRAPFHLIFVDHQMPDMGGLELARNIRAAPGCARVPLVLLTSIEHARDERAMAEAGISGHLTKPIKHRRLLQCALEVLGIRPAELERTPSLVTESTLEATELRRRPWVLVVEDNPVNQRVTVGMLRKFGCCSEVAVNGAEALAALARRSFDVVLMDCQMPVMDGYAATRAIRARENGIHHQPIVAMTANALGGDRQRCLDAGMDDYLAKPVAPEQMLAVLRPWIEKPRVDPHPPGPAPSAS